VQLSVVPLQTIGGMKARKFNPTKTKNKDFFLKNKY